MGKWSFLRGSVILHSTFQGPSSENALTTALNVSEHSLHSISLQDPQLGLNQIFFLSCFEGLTLPKKNYSIVRASTTENS